MLEYEYGLTTSLIDNVYNLFQAKERREGKTDYDESEVVSTTANYRAVAPDAKQ